MENLEKKNGMDWETIYTIFTLIAIGLGCWSCFVPKSDFGFAINSAILLYFCGIVVSYDIAHRKHK